MFKNELDDFNDDARSDFDNREILDDNFSERTSYRPYAKVGYKFDAEPEDAKVVLACVEKLNAERLDNHLMSLLGMAKSVVNAKTAVSRVAKVLCYTYKRVHNEDLIEDQTMTWFRDLIFKKYEVLKDFCQDKLSDELLMNPGSIGSYLNDLTSAAVWLISYWPKRESILSEFQMASLSVGFERTKSALLKSYSAAKKRQHANTKSMDQYIHLLKV